MDFGASGFRSLNELAAELQRLAEEKGFRENIDDPRGKAAVAVYVANFHEEASELWGAARCDKLHKSCDKADKMRAAGHIPMTCLEEEAADMIIRALDIGDVFGVDIDRAVRLEYVTRSVEELCLPKGQTIADVAEYVDAYHGVASAIKSDARIRAISDARMPIRIGVMLGIMSHVCDVFKLSQIGIIMRKHAFNKTRSHRHGGKLV